MYGRGPADEKLFLDAESLPHWTFVTLSVRFLGCRQIRVCGSPGHLAILLVHVVQVQIQSCPSVCEDMSVFQYVSDRQLVGV